MYSLLKNHNLLKMFMFVDHDLLKIPVDLDHYDCEPPYKSACFWNLCLFATWSL